MNIFVDTEFTDFVRPQLISIGLATDDNQHFYAEHHPAEDWCCSDFVKQVVLPQLGKRQDRVMDANRLCIELNSWLDQFAQREPVICFDFDLDWTPMVTALKGEIPHWLPSQNVYYQINDLVLGQFRLESGLSDHHALHDALGNQFAYLAKFGKQYVDIKPTY